MDGWISDRFSHTAVDSTSLRGSEHSTLSYWSADSVSVEGLLQFPSDYALLLLQIPCLNNTFIGLNIFAKILRHMLTVTISYCFFIRVKSRSKFKNGNHKRQCDWKFSYKTGFTNFILASQMYSRSTHKRTHVRHVYWVTKWKKTAGRHQADH